jgi:hypothetical protein
MVTFFFPQSYEQDFVLMPPQRDSYPTAAHCSATYDAVLTRSSKQTASYRSIQQMYGATRTAWRHLLAREFLS